jgi:predicted acyltransferase
VTAKWKESSLGLRFVKMTALRLQSIVTDTMSATESLASPAPKANREAVTENHSARLMCLDVFRGLAVAGMILVDNPGSDQKAHHLITHAEWNDWTPADFIFPSFLFLVGISLVLTGHWLRSPKSPAIIYSLCAVLFCWSLLWLLWRKRIFLKL